MNIFTRENLSGLSTGVRVCEEDDEEKKEPATEKLR
jgi:hypothetical protein